MKKVVIRAPLLSKSGYGEHSRQLFQYLLSIPNIEVKTQTVPWGITPWNVNHSAFNGLAGEAIRRSVSDMNEKFDVSFQVQLPNEWDPSIADFNVGVTAGVETDRCNTLWTSIHCNKMNMVIVPSNHTKKCIETSGSLTTPIHVVPEAYFSELVEPGDDIDLDLETDFNFLTVGVLTGHTPETDRKNLFYLIKWFIEEFKNDKNIGLVVKTNRGRETTIDKQLTSQMLRQVLNELGYKENPKVYLLHGEMSRKEMNDLYKHPKIKCLISATRGEGFGLPLLEASVAGLPVLATNWSAHKEFLDSGKWIKFDYTLSNLPNERLDNNIFVPGSKWANPKEESVKRAMRKFVKSPDVPKKWAENLSDTLIQSHSINSIIKKYSEVLSEVLH